MQCKGQNRLYASLCPSFYYLPLAIIIINSGLHLNTNVLVKYLLVSFYTSAICISVSTLLVLYIQILPIPSTRLSDSVPASPHDLVNLFPHPFCRHSSRFFLKLLTLLKSFFLDLPSVERLWSSFLKSAHFLSSFVFCPFITKNHASYIYIIISLFSILDYQV